jgi:hypothetical protein
VPKVTVSDTTTTCDAVEESFQLDLPQSCTLRELIRFRVREDVAKHNVARSPVFQGLAHKQGASQRDESVSEYAGWRRIDWEHQADIAETAFLCNAFFVFVDDRQVEDLDEIVLLENTEHLEFVRLVPLAGG